MSTFDGIIAEFPDIRIDYFRQSSSQQNRPALAYFLSHVHSDHLQGLETCRSPFIWCSPATREILLRLEKYPHRMNFAKGILESRQQTYRHLKKILRPIPLEAPTEIELVPGRSIRVTLLDANHCVGACMFLIEGDGKAILYTGDIRAEIWWVNSIIRNPVMVPYARHGSVMPQKRLDTVYLDTTFASKSDRYRHFQSKAEGISELLQKVAQYPPDTEFYIDAWTFGYEDVWQALSVFLRSQIHVDDYRYGLYSSLHNGAEPKAPEAYKLIRTRIGNEEREGCLSTRYQRLHSCERGTGCTVFNNDFVRITPIISRHNGQEMAELGAGGGQGDLNQQHELEIDDSNIFQKLMSLCVEKLHSQPELLSGVVQMLTATTVTGGSAIQVQLADLANGDGTKDATQDAGDDMLDDLDELPLEKVVSVLAKRVSDSKSDATATSDRPAIRPGSLPKHITFPYSRHASYGELCAFMEALLPKDIYPCTVDKSGWGPEHSMSYLFGRLYKTPPDFRHDKKMMQDLNEVHEENCANMRQTRASDGGTQDSADPNDELTQICETPVKHKVLFPMTVHETNKRASNTEMSQDGKRVKATPQEPFHSTQVESRGSREPTSRRPSAMISRIVKSEAWLRTSALLTEKNARSAGIIDAPRSSSDQSPLARSVPETEAVITSRPSNNHRRRTTSSDQIHALSTPTPVRHRPQTSQHFTELVGDALKEALQRNAYDTVLGDGTEWSLVSVDGHTLKEEEL
ncbi:hypothetical protein CKM354_000623200 [Cercospora kikuchii]|uniref:Metallo-beta-lactamase domain-containing protein n=1 Tax=Cercospora kikuchii TaxID=84275 RepID=A0A9P3CHR4_9PEZI|nr:uncharacterized protein CKM354_000623200 [Cercospora kikuchii]GIZ42986.1 hypothetical protein CKM354_000623200 [Cercospora kikuchii]